MKIFIDSAKLEEIQLADSYGILDGVTTNPTRIKKAVQSSSEKMDMDSYIREILKLMDGRPVSLEVIGTSYEEMVQQAIFLYKRFNSVAKNVFVKIPISTSINKRENIFDGIKTIKALSSRGIPVNCTLIFTPEQALLAAKAGATYVSPFVGRIDDFIRTNNKIKFEKSDYFSPDGIKKNGKVLEDNGIISGVDLVSRCVDIFNQYNIQTEVLAASLRNPRQVRECSLVGADIATLPLSVMKDLLIHEKTVEGMKNFMKDTVPEYRNVLEKR